MEYICGHTDKIGGVMRTWILSLIILCSFVITTPLAVADTGQGSLTPSKSQFNSYIQKVVSGLDPQWNSKVPSPFLKANNGFDFFLPGSNAQEPAIGISITVILLYVVGLTGFIYWRLWRAGYIPIRTLAASGTIWVITSCFIYYVTLFTQQ